MFGISIMVYYVNNMPPIWKFYLKRLVHWLVIVSFEVGQMFYQSY
jgi:hypothetical protein